MRPEAERRSARGIEFRLGAGRTVEPISLRTGRVDESRLYLSTGVAVLLTTELGVLDARLADFRGHREGQFPPREDRWSVSRLYFFFLWGEILLGSRFCSGSRRAAGSDSNRGGTERWRDVSLFAAAVVPQRQNPAAQPVHYADEVHGDRLVVRVFRLLHLASRRSLADGALPVTNTNPTRKQGR